MDPLMVAFTHGEDFDLAGGLAELVSQFSCEACGTPRPIISLGSRDEALAREDARLFISERPSRRYAGERW